MNSGKRKLVKSLEATQWEEDPDKHFRHIMLFGFNEGLSPFEAAANVREVYGDHSVGNTTAKNWFEHFKQGQFDLDDATLFQRLPEVDDDRLHTVICEDLQQQTILRSEGTSNKKLKGRVGCLGPIGKEAEETVQVKEEPCSSDLEEDFETGDEKLSDEELMKFGEDLISKMKDLSEVDSVKLMLEIQELVTKTRLKYLKNLEEDRPNFVDVRSMNNL